MIQCISGYDREIEEILEAETENRNEASRKHEEGIKETRSTTKGPYTHKEWDINETSDSTEGIAESSTRKFKYSTVFDAVTQR